MPLICRDRRRTRLPCLARAARANSPSPLVCLTLGHSWPADMADDSDEDVETVVKKSGYVSLPMGSVYMTR